VDALGQRTAIAFSNWKRNPAFAKGTFSYVPGKGVDVIGG
jgi:outer membrane lipoprotein carrier protein